MMLNKVETQIWRLHCSGERQQTSLTDKTYTQPPGPQAPMPDGGPTAGTVCVWRADLESPGIASMSTRRHYKSHSKLIPSEFVCVQSGVWGRSGQILGAFFGILSKSCILCLIKMSIVLKLMILSRSTVSSVRYAP